MPAPLDPERRLLLLNAVQPGHPWTACEEKRKCILCERTFRGSAVLVRRALSRPQLCCPGCRSGPAYWVRVGNPLLEDAAWNEWEKAIDLHEQTH